MSRDEHPTWSPHHADCPQCAESKGHALPKRKSSAKQNKVIRRGDIIYLKDYIAERMATTRQHLGRIERKTSELMSRLIREKDQSVARRLQRDIGRLEGTYSDLRKFLMHDQGLHKRLCQSRSR